MAKLYLFYFKYRYMFRYIGIIPLYVLYLRYEKENLHQPFEISFNEHNESLLTEHEHTFLN